MNTDNQTPEEVDESRNDVATYGDDTLGENTGDSALETQVNKEATTKAEDKQTKSDGPQIETIVPENDN